MTELELEITTLIRDLQLLFHSMPERIWRPQRATYGQPGQPQWSPDQDFDSRVLFTTLIRGFTTLIHGFPTFIPRHARTHPETPESNLGTSRSTPVIISSIFSRLSHDFQPKFTIYNFYS